MVILFPLNVTSSSGKDGKLCEDDNSVYDDTPFESLIIFDGKWFINGKMVEIRGMGWHAVGNDKIDRQCDVLPTVNAV